MDANNRTPYQVRRATQADVPELVRMQMALQRSMARISRRLLQLDDRSLDKLCTYYQAQIEDSQARVLIGLHRETDRAVAMGAGKIWVHADYLPPKSGELIDLWVDPDHRRRGLANRLIAALVQFFRARDVEFLSVNYVEGNTLADLLWRRLGFHPAVLTAAAQRQDVEIALGAATSRIVPVTYRPVSTNDVSAPAGRALSG
jgi:ribosomal protein S18 acetylase RimI-like enzyme